MASYTLYIDESGETGISKIRSETESGASPYMTLGGVLIDNDKKSQLEDKLLEIRKKTGKKTLHCSKLKHIHKVLLARTVSQEPIVCFGVISRKATLDWYKNMISNDSVKYFNKCGQYLLERVGKFMKEYNIKDDQLEIIFEEGAYNYAKFRSLIGKCQQTPLHENTKLLRHIKLSKIVDAPKSKEPLLQLADLTAHALFKAVDKSENNHHIPEPRYLSEILKRFYCDKDTGKVIQHGLMALHSLTEVQLDAEVNDMITNVEAKMLLPLN